MRVIVRSMRVLPALGAAAVLLLWAPPAPAMGEADRLWLVGERAFDERLYLVARRALGRLVAAHGSDPRVPEATLLLGKSQFAMEDYAASVESFRRAQRFKPPPGKPEEARFWEGEALFRLKRYAEARAVYDALLRDNARAPVAADAMYGRAWAELELGQLEAAARTFGEFLAAWPDSPLGPTATFHRARALVELKRQAEAVQLLAPFIARHPGHALVAEARYLLGMSRLQTGQGEGIRDLREFLRAEPRHELAATARHAVAEALLRHGTKAEMAEEHRALMSLSPATPEGLFDAGLLAHHAERSKDAEAAWRRLRAEFPAHPLSTRAALELAQLAFRRGQFEEAGRLAAHARDSEDAALRMEALLIAGESDLKRKRYEDALRAFGSAVEVEGADPTLRFRALAGSGLAHEELKQWEEATRLYGRVAADSPDEALRKWARDRIEAVKVKSQPPPPPKADEPKPPEPKADAPKAPAKTDKPRPPAQPKADEPRS